MNNLSEPCLSLCRKRVFQRKFSRSSFYILSTLLPFLLLFTSCSTQRKIIKAPIKEEGADFLFKKLKEHELKYSTFKANFSAEYENKGQSNSFSGQIRIRKDSMIWLSFTPALGIEVFRMMVTQDSVKFINNMNKTFFTGDYGYVNRYLHTNIDFDILQSFLTGNDLSFYENGKFRAGLDNNIYKLSTADRMKLKKFIRNSQEKLRILIQNIWIDPQNFKIVRADVKEIKEPNMKLQADYSSFETIGEQLFPKELSFDISADNNLHVELSLTKITINIPLVTPFRVPQSYHPVKVNPGTDN
jgi:outer membrane lipoprotein-sorting protein